MRCQRGLLIWGAVATLLVQFGCFGSPPPVQGEGDRPTETPASDPPTETPASKPPTETPASKPPTETPASNPPLPEAVPVDADSLFHQLTARVWKRGEPGAFGASETFELRRDGDYHWQRVSDYVEKDDQGRFGLVLTGKNTGLLHLSGGSDLSFEINNEKLRFAGLEFTPGDPIQYDAEESQLGPGDLKSVEPSDEWKRLVSTPWKKSNEFDLYRCAERVVFKEDGRFLASYRGGECQHGGRWNLVVETGRRLSVVSDPNRCDQRGPGTASPFAGNDVPEWIDDLLVCYASSYFPERTTTDKKVFVYDAYARSVRTVGEYQGEFRKGVPMAIAISHTNVTDQHTPKDLLSFEVSIRRLKRTRDAFQYEGEEIVPVRKDLQGIRLAAGEAYEHEIEIAPPISGEVNLQFRLRYKDIHQEYDGKRGYVLHVRDGDRSEPSGGGNR